MDLSRELQAAVAAVQAAGRYCRHVQDTLITETLSKDDRSPVTIGDYGAQAIVCRELHRQFPTDAIVAEEHAAELMRSGAMGQHLTEAIASTYDSDADLPAICRWLESGSEASSSRRWILDPVDGTKGFLRKEQYAIALALEVSGELRLGVLGCPNLPDRAGNAGCLFYALSDGQAVEIASDGSVTPLQVSQALRSDQIVLVESVESGHGDHTRQGAVAAALGVARPAVRYDSQAKYAVVARGQASAYIRLPNPKTPDYREKIWDHAAGYVIVTAAGGRVTDIEGRALDFKHATRLEDNRGVIATNGACHQAVLDAVASVG